MKRSTRSLIGIAKARRSEPAFAKGGSGSGRQAMANKLRQSRARQQAYKQGVKKAAGHSFL